MQADVQTPPSRPRPVSNETFGMVLFIVAEVMFFAGLVSAYIVLRTGAAEWRPRGLPPLVNWVSLSNTGLLCASGVSMLLAMLAVRRDDPDGLKIHLGATLVLGCVFVGVQVYEFWRLLVIVPYSGNLFGSVFYTLTVLHALHVVGGVALLALVLGRAFGGKYHRYRSTGVTIAGLYWTFVVIVWVFLYCALYVW